MFNQYNDLSKVALIGSFRKEREKFIDIYDYLNNHFKVVTPVNIDFVDHSAEFVKAHHEYQDTERQIQDRILAKFHDAEVIWLFAPNGYVGVSAAFELGYLHALGKPIYTDHEPTDPLIAAYITAVVKSVRDLESVIGRH